jgi:hypothetical protein
LRLPVQWRGFEGPNNSGSSFWFDCFCGISTSFSVAYDVRITMSH